MDEKELDTYLDDIEDGKDAITIELSRSAIKTEFAKLSSEINRLERRVADARTYALQHGVY